MEKVVILARVSTDKQDYERQVNELTDYCRKMDWEVEKVFTNKVSGAKKNEEREEMQELISYVNSHQIRRVVCLEISRMGRNTLEALKVIQILNEHKVSLYVKNYNLYLSSSPAAHASQSLYNRMDILVIKATCELMNNFFYGRICT